MSAVLAVAFVPRILDAQSSLISVANRRDVVFDHSGRFLYITTADGFVRQYNLVSGVFGQTYNLGGSLNGVDIAEDDSFLLVAQGVASGSTGICQKIDLGTGAVTNISYPLAVGDLTCQDLLRRS